MADLNLELKVSTTFFLIDLNFRFKTSETEIIEFIRKADPNLPIVLAGPNSAEEMDIVLKCFKILTTISKKAPLNRIFVKLSVEPSTKRFPSFRFLLTPNLCGSAFFSKIKIQILLLAPRPKISTRGECTHARGRSAKLSLALPLADFGAELLIMAAGGGFEPPIFALTGRCCTTQLPGNIQKTAELMLDGLYFLLNKRSPSSRRVIIIVIIDISLHKLNLSNFQATVNPIVIPNIQAPTSK